MNLRVDLLVVVMYVSGWWWGSEWAIDESS
jgi:hypothetical protein